MVGTKSCGFPETFFDQRVVLNAAYTYQRSLPFSWCLDDDRGSALIIFLYKQSPIAENFILSADWITRETRFSNNLRVLHECASCS